MRALFACALGWVVLVGAGGAQAETVQGQMQLQWGDPRSGVMQPHKPGKFLATLVADDGTRYALDPAEARLAAGDLYALANRRVAVAFAVQSAPSASPAKSS